MNKRRKTAVFLAASVLGAALSTAVMPAFASAPSIVPSNFATAGSAAPTYGAAAEIVSYANLVHASYDRAYKRALVLQTSIAALLEKPDAATLSAAREAWIGAHVAYSETEAFRFYEGPIDFAAQEDGDEGPEGRLNAWPLNEAFIDYVKGDAKAGLINDTSIKLTQKSIRERDQVSDESDVTTGYHAVEFLLWGQDLSLTGPGARPASDYVAGNEINDRRRLYLKTVTEGIVDDMLWLTSQWDMRLGKVYAHQFVALDQRDALGRILTGMATLSGFELASERMSVALDSGDQEDETSCFSDTSHLAFRADQQSIANIWFGTLDDWKGQGLQGLVARVDPDLEKRVSAQVLKTNAALDAVPAPVDNILASEEGSAGRAKMEAAVTELLEESKLFVEVGKALGLNISVPSE